MNKVFFGMFVVSSFVYASESPSPKSSPRSKQINSSSIIDLDQTIKSTKKIEKSRPQYSRVRRQSQDFNTRFRNEENVTHATLRRNSNELK